MKGHGKISSLQLPLIHKRPCRFNIATNPGLQDGIAKELSEAGLLAHGQEREPRLPSYDDVEKLPYLNAVSPSEHLSNCIPL